MVKAWKGKPLMNLNEWRILVYLLLQNHVAFTRALSSRGRHRKKCIDTNLLKVRCI